ncbi:MAG: maltose ABC transporter substrate-binding protein [Actinomycetales bacterium]|nr:maltose ABC transporter substrate-binding protein [Actinomycetales bacterium]
MRKRLTLSAVAVASTLLLAACSSAPAPAPESPSPTEAATETASPSEEPAPSGAELVVWVDENRQPAVADAAAKFEAETGATVSLVVKNFADIRTDFIAQAPTGEGPDIIVGAHDWTGALVTAGVVETIDLGDKAGAFEKVALDAFAYDGQLYGLPYALEAIALVQNVDLVGTEAPATWDDMIAKGKEAGTERAVVINVSATGDGYTSYGFQTSFGAPVFEQDESGSYTTTVGMGGENGVAFAKFLAENGQKGEGHFTTDIDYDINQALFSEGKAPYTIQGPWAIGAYTDAGIEVAVNPIPKAGDETPAPFVGVQGFYVSAQSQNKLLANEFLVNYIATEEAQQALYDADPRIPAFTAVAEKVAADPIVAGFYASASAGVPMPSIPEMGLVWDLWNAAEAAIITGSEPEATWNKMVEDLEAAIAG